MHSDSLKVPPPTLITRGDLSEDPGHWNPPAALVVVLAMVPHAHLDPGPGPHRTDGKLVVRVVNIPDLPTRVRCHGELPTSLDWMGCQWFVQRVHL